MGKRTIRVAEDFLVDLLKGPGERPRSFTIEHALPSDTRLVGMRPEVMSDQIVFVLESESWDGADVTELLPIPVGRVEYPRVDALA